MKTTLNSTEFKNALQRANYIATNRQLPVLSYAKLTINKDNSKIVTTDLEKAVEISLNSNGQDEFEVLLPRRRIQTFLYGKDGNTSIEVDTIGKVTLERAEGDLQFKPYKPKDFPPMPTPANDTTWSTIDAKWFCQMLGIVIKSCAKENSRPILTGAVFTDGAMASADGFRLAYVKSDKLQLGLGNQKVIIPAQTLVLAKRLFYKEDKLTIGFHIPDRVYFKSDKILLTSQTIQGNYPDYKQLVPNSYTTKVSFSAPLMMQRLNMIDPKALTSGIARLQFRWTEPNDEPECLLSGGVSVEDCGEYYSMKLPVKIETQEEAKIAIQHQYLCDAIRPFSMCNLELNSPSSPMKFTGDIEGLTIVVMPMYVQW